MKEILNEEDFNHWIEFLKSTVLDLKLCGNNIEGIINENRGKDSFKIDLIKPFLGHYVFLCYSHLTISLIKLFDEKEKMSFVKWFNKLDNFKVDSKIKEGMTIDFHLLKKELEAIKNSIESNKEIIDIVKNRRNTFYAHYDPQKKAQPEKLTDIVKLTELAESIFNKLYGIFNDRTFLFETSYWNISQVTNLVRDRFDLMKQIEDGLTDENI